MVAKANHSTLFAVLPSQEIRELSKSIRKQWTPEQRQFRAQLAEQKLSKLAPYLFDILH